MNAIINSLRCDECLKPMTVGQVEGNGPVVAYCTASHCSQVDKKYKAYSVTLEPVESTNAE